MTVEEALGLVEEIKNCSLPWDDAHWEAFDIVINYVKDKLNNSDKSISEFDIQPQPKQEWSEEDNSRLKEVLYYIEYINRTNATFQQRDLTHLISWLKSLRPQSQWKPSDAQMASITCAVRKMKESACYDSELVSLFNDLKKLKE